MSADRDHCVLVFAPIGRDGTASAELFRHSGLEAINCRTFPELISEMSAGVGAVCLAEEGLFGRDTTPLAQWIERQPPWSDLPFVDSHQSPGAAGGRCLAPEYRPAPPQRVAARTAGSADHADQRGSIGDAGTPPAI